MKLKTSIACLNPPPFIPSPKHHLALADVAHSKEFIVSIDMEEGDLLGAIPNGKMVVTKVHPGSLADGKLEVGNRILRVNGNSIRDSNHFFHLLRYATPCVRLTVYRDGGAKAAALSNTAIPMEKPKKANQGPEIGNRTSPKDDYAKHESGKTNNRSRGDVVYSAKAVEPTTTGSSKKQLPAANQVEKRQKSTTPHGSDSPFVDR